MFHMILYVSLSNIIRIIIYIYNSIYFLINLKYELDQEKNKNELLKKELIYSNKLIISFIKKRTDDKKQIKKLETELLSSDRRNSVLLKRIEHLRNDLNQQIDYISMREELKELKHEYSNLIKSLEIAKIESSNAILILKYANERNKSLKKELEETKASSILNICSICCENKINICCIPCGHIYCDKCIRVPENNNCYICRQNFYRILKIYI